jgi:hypothetical protein
LIPFDPTRAFAPTFSGHKRDMARISFAGPSQMSVVEVLASSGVSGG